MHRLTCWPRYKAFPELQPGRAIRDTAIRSIVLMDAQIDHTTGLLMLREGRPLEIYCTDMVREDLSTGNPLFKILEHYCGVRWQRLPVEAGNTILRCSAPRRCRSPRCR